MPYKIAVNIHYIRNRSFGGDIKIIFLTLAKLFWKFPDSVVVSNSALLTQKTQLEALAERGG
jgi:lipopolysaccharide/colanic/teichoic acid biosynthesis glycosyltransferase